MDKIRPHIWDIAVVVFAFAVLGFGAARARHDLRWSAWAMGDAQMLNAARHFAREGFRDHYFLTYYHPGYLGKSVGNESASGYYTRYPSGSGVFFGAVIRKSGENLPLLKTIPVFFAALALLAFYMAVSRVASKRAAFFAAFFAGTSVGFLQFLDCLSPYMFSEFFRFSAMALFLVSEKNDDKPRISWGLLGGVWLLLFADSFNSFDYIIFMQLFFGLYYFLSGKKWPWGKFAFLVSAPLLGCFLHYWQGHLALAQFGMSAPGSLLKGFLDKTYPFHKGPLHVLSFITYFLRMMENSMVRHNYGFGFSLAFLMYGAAALLGRNGKLESAAGWTLPKAVLLFLLPGLSWWLIFPNHSASFFYTALHVLPGLGLLFGLCVHNALTFFKESESRSGKAAALVVLLGCFWPAFIFTGKYLKEYPNPLDPSRWVTLGDWDGLDTAAIRENVKVSREVGKQTAYGDIVLVPEALSVQHYFFGYYADRRMDDYGGKTAADLEAKINALRDYRREGAGRYKIFNPDLKLYALADRREDSEISRRLASLHPVKAEIGPHWVLYSLDETASEKPARP